MIFQKTVEKAYRAQMYTRHDDTGCVFYFSAGDFPGLQSTPFSFPAKSGYRLQGYFYSYPDPDDHRLIVFDHGMGGGHRAYMKEIELLCRHGYRVFSYDHSGCMESEGEHSNGFAQSLSDLDACLNALKQNEFIRDRKISVMGHSWGAYACLNITALHPEVEKVVAISGFASVERMLSQLFSGVAKGFRAPLWEMEQKSNPDYCAFDALETLGKTQSRVLVIHSADDPTVNPRAHFDVMKSELSRRENIRFLLVNGKGHNPNYTADAVAYLGEFSRKLKKQHKKLKTDSDKAAFLKSWDWNRMTAQDEEVWKEIFAFLDE